MSEDFKSILNDRISRRELLKRAGAGAGVLAIPGLLAACGGGDGTATTGAATNAGANTTAAAATTTSGVPTAGAVKIGFVSPRTGPAASFGEPDGYILETVRKQLAGGITVGGKVYSVEIIDKDGQTNPARGAEVAQELINQDKVDLILTTSTPETINPVSDAAEAGGVPCISTVCPWEAWYFGRGAKPGEPSPFKFSYIFSFGVEQFYNAYASQWPLLQTNKKVGVMWPNDADGNAIRGALGPMLTKAGYTIVDPGAYEDGTNDYSTQIAMFKKEDCQIFQNFSLPPDFATFWRQAAQQGYKPIIAQCSKAGLFPSEIEALGEIGYNLSEAVYWAPIYPYKSSLTGLSSQQLADGYEQSTGKQWNQQLGPSLSLFDAGIAALTASGNPNDKAAVAAAIGKLSVETPVGRLSWGSGPVANVVVIPIIDGQWVKGAKWPVEWKSTENFNDTKVPIEAKLLPYA